LRSFTFLFCKGTILLSIVNQISRLSLSKKDLARNPMITKNSVPLQQNINTGKVPVFFVIK
jgi:hypothetical protein